MPDTAAPVAVPAGTVTLLFTDIEGSTEILAGLGSRYAEVLATQRSILRSAFARWDGHELGTEGDSFFVVFRSVGQALSAALDGQRGLAAATWPDGVSIRVRMGMHTGEPTPYEDGYVGMDVHRAARVASSAHGGQVVVSEPTLRIAVAQDLPDVSFVDLGEHRLKGLPHPERLFQVTAPGLASRFPPLRSLGAASDLPVPATSFVGRRAERAEVTALLSSQGAARLVTLTGAGGTGKSRLALAVAAEVQGTFPDGVYFVPLASVTTADVMWTTIADVLGVVGESKAPPSFLEHLSSRRALLVLDNLEQLADAPSVVAEILRRAPDVRVLATSRRPLRLSGEHEVAVEPLRVGGGGSGDLTADDDAAVQLFVERARLVRSGFSLTPDNADDVRDICARLDGLPLAIELAAARSKLLSPRALRSRLDSALELSRVAVDGPQRQRTLRQTLDWSLRLLTAEQQAAFRRLGACDGDFDLSAAAAVVSTAQSPAGDGPPPLAGLGDLADRGGRGDRGDTALDGMDVLDVVTELVDASLLTVREGPDGEPRLRMLRTVALYARELLERDDDAEAVRRRHAEHYAAVAAEASALLRRRHHLTGRDRLERELPNFRSALAWAFDAPAGAAGARVTTGLRLCEHLGWFWYGCGYPAEGRRWLETAVRAAGGMATPDAMTSLHALGVLVMQRGDAARAQDLLEGCLAYWRGAGDSARIADELNSLGLACRAAGEVERARVLVEEAVDVARRAGLRRAEANAVTSLAILAIDAHRSDEAIGLLRRCLELDTELQDVWGQAADHLNLASALLRADRVDEAWAHLCANAATATGLGDVEMTVDLLDLFCAVHARRGHAGRAARLLGATARIRRETELPLAGPDAAWFEGVLALVRGRPDVGTWERNLASGAAMGVEDALAEAMAVPVSDERG